MERRIDGGAIAAGLGALLLFVSLFLDWYAPDLSAWTVFETLDMVLAMLCLATFILVVPKALGRPIAGGPPEGLLLGVGAAAFVIVGIQLLNHPPAAIGLDEEVGAWLALGGAILMLAGRRPLPLPDHPLGAGARSRRGAAAPARERRRCHAAARRARGAGRSGASCRARQRPPRRAGSRTTRTLR